MIAAWMLYCTLVGLVLGGAARLAEAALRPIGRPVRGLWIAAMGGTAVLPALALLMRWRSGRATGTAGGWIELGLPVLGAPEGGGELPAGWQETAVELTALLGPLDGPLLLLWGVASTSLMALFLLSLRRLGRERRGWRCVQVEGLPVRISRDRGPAVLGFLRGVVVLPDWALTLDDERRRLVLLHEREHLRAGDHRLSIAGLLLAVALPWNPALWWQLRRVRLALEVDCDRRVLASGVAPGTYGRLLLAVTGRLRYRFLAAPALGESGTDLERRIEVLTERPPRRPIARAVLSLAAAIALVAVACEAPPPVVPTHTSPEGSAVPSSPETDRQEQVRPAFIPYDTPPRLRNPEATRRTLQELYPADLLAEGIGGRVELWLLIDELGRVREAQIKTSSEIEVLDEAAREVTRAMEFQPAEHRGVPTRVWVGQWITFETPERT